MAALQMVALSLVTAGCIELPDAPPRPAPDGGTTSDGGVQPMLDCELASLRNTLPTTFDAEGNTTVDADGTRVDDGTLVSATGYALPLRLVVWVAFDATSEALIALRAPLDERAAGVRIALANAVDPGGDRLTLSLPNAEPMVTTPPSGWVADRYRVVITDDGTTVAVDVFDPSGAQVMQVGAADAFTPGRHVKLGGTAATFSDLELCATGTCQAARVADGIPDWLEATDDGVQPTEDGVVSIARSTLRSSRELTPPIHAEVDLTWTGGGIAFIGTRSTGLRSPPFDEPASSAIARVHNNVNGINAMYVGDFHSGGAQTVVGHTDITPTFDRPYRIAFDDDGTEITVTWIDLVTGNRLETSIVPGGTPPAEYFVASGDPTVEINAVTLCAPR